MISVVLGQFEYLVGLGLVTALRRDRSVIVVASDVSASAIVTAAKLCASPTVIVAPEHETTLETLCQWRSALPSVGIVVVVNHEVAAHRARYAACSAMAVDLRVPLSQLLATIRSAASQTTEPRLTPREAEVLTYLNAYCTHREIAEHLQISLETARTHTASVRRKLGVRRNRDLVARRDPPLRSS